MVFRGHSRNEESSGMMSKSQTSKFLGKSRSGNSQYASTNSSLGMESKFSEHDVQKEFLRLYTQLEWLKEKNMRIGNRHLASKILAMQDAASRHDNEQTEWTTRKDSKISNTMCVMSEKLQTTEEVDEESTSPIKNKRQNVSFAKSTEDISTEFAVNDRGEPSTGAGACIELKSREERGDNIANKNGRLLKSGHARTHAIVINLDDKSRFTEEVTV